MIRFQGIHIAKIYPVCAAPEGTVMHNEHGTISNGLVMDANTLIGHEWHSPSPSRRRIQHCNLDQAQASKVSGALKPSPIAAMPCRNAISSSYG